MVVVDAVDPGARTDLVAEACADLAAAGWQVVTGWSTVGRSTGPVVAAGTVAAPADVTAAVLAAVRGAALVVDARVDRSVVEGLCDELRRLGRVERRAPEAGWVPLAADERRLLDLLAGGATLGEAAGRLHLSRRSADRRVAAARDRLGVPTVAAAVAVRRSRRAAVLPPAR